MQRGLFETISSAPGIFRSLIEVISPFVVYICREDLLRSHCIINEKKEKVFFKKGIKMGIKIGKTYEISCVKNI